MNNIRFALRTLRRNPGFALIAILTLAIGIGANMAIFSGVDALLLHPLPYRHAGELVLVRKNMPMFSLIKSDSSPLDFTDYRSLNSTFASSAGIDTNSVNLTGEGDPLRVAGLRVSPSLFPMLGVEPILGRVFRPEEDNVVILGAPLWRNRFGADRNVLGRQVQLNDQTFTVIGVVEPVLTFLDPSELYLPFTLTPALLAPNMRGHQSVDVIARLKPGVTLAQARADMQTVAARMTAKLPDWYPKGWSIDADPLADSVAGDLRTPLVVLLCAVGFVLLIGCANVANLLLARASGRQTEMGIRAAMGATRKQIVLQLLTESAVLAALAGIAGLAIGLWCLDLFRHYAPPNLMNGQNASGSALAISVTFVLALCTSLLFGLMPAISASRTNLRAEIIGSGAKLRGFLVAAEVALSLMLLVSAGLVLRSFHRLNTSSPGFHADHLFTARIALPPRRYPKPEQARSFEARLLEHVSALPGVEAAAFADGMPYGSSFSGGSFNIVGRQWGANRPDLWRVFVTPDYFRAMRIPVMQGRAFTEQDAATAPPVALVDETFARQFFPDGDAIGHEILNSPLGPAPFRIVGIVGGVKDRSLITPPRPTIYYSVWQGRAQGGNLVVRTSGDPLALTSAIQAHARELDSGLPVYRIATMEQLIANSLARRRLSTMLLAILASLALVLAVIGIYGVISYSVSRRTREIGVRMALGAQAGDVQALVLGQGMRPVFAGLAIGLAGSLAATRLLASLLYQTAANDPATFLGVSVLLVCSALLAGFVPARRAAKADPLKALRYE